MDLDRARGKISALTGVGLIFNVFPIISVGTEDFESLSK